MKNHGGTERGAAEEASGTPLTETEIRAAQRPPGEGDQAARSRAEKKAAEAEIETAEQRRATDQ